MVKHTLAQVGGNRDRRAEKAYAPQKPPHDHKQNDPDHRQADLLHQHGLVKGQGLPVDDHLPQIYAVDDQPVQAGNQKLDVVHHQQRRQTQQQDGGIFEVISVDVLAKYHGGDSLFSLVVRRFGALRQDVP